MTPSSISLAHCVQVNIYMRISLTYTSKHGRDLHDKHAEENYLRNVLVPFDDNWCRIDFASGRRIKHVCIYFKSPMDRKSSPSEIARFVKLSSN
ncbi:hypothetical protein KP79_PYT05266 [Mizuhopecten yessoensis]|uniref:Uncharacterized protein n=1 Tax=Mizuhopecten yessoensis TaxID=6573 RepID=A0A210QY19_MIZYE|nr:hypothetical protein KP79_PYT05266 [Mizuhopecten yessoensis]